MDAPDYSNLGFTSNPYLQGQVDSALGDTARAYNLTTAPAFNNAMVNSGSFGNSGVQQMQGEAQRQLQTSLGRQANDMRSNNFWQGQQFDNNNYWQNQQFDRGVYNDTFNQNQQQFQNGLNLLGVQNSANSQNLGFGTQIQNTPMNYYQGFSNTANSIGQGYGNATQQQTAPGSPLMGALGGAQLGTSLYNQYRNSSTPDYSAGTNAGWGNLGGGAGNYNEGGGF